MDCRQATWANGVNPPAREHALTAAESEQFDRQGFCGPFTAFTPEEMAPIHRIICEGVLESPASYSSYRTQMRHVDSLTVWRLCSAPAILGRLVSLYGPDLIVWYSNFFDKGHERPELQGAYPWHQDEMPFAEVPMSTLSVWLAITPATVENGCVEIIPGTHTRPIPVLRQTDARLAAWFAGREADRSYFNEADKVALVLEPGQFFLFDGRVLHRSNLNRTRERRIGFSFRVALPRLKLGLSRPLLLLSGEDQSGVNPLAPPPTRDPWPGDRPTGLPGSADYVFDHRLHGLGWHLLERDGETWFRWTGPEKDSWLDLGWRGDGGALLRCRILHAIAPRVLESLQVRVNNQPVPLQWRQEGRFVEIQGKVSADLLKTGEDRVRISFHVAEVLRPCDLQASSADTRSLGVAIAGISLTPLDRQDSAAVRAGEAANDIRP